MEAAIKEMRRFLVADVGIDVSMLSPGSIGNGNSGYSQTTDHGRVQWGMVSNGVAVFYISHSDSQYVAIGIGANGDYEHPISKTPTAACFDSAVAWVAMDR